MLESADTGGRVFQLARLLLGEPDQVVDRADGKTWVDREHIWPGCQNGDGCERFDGVVIMRCVFPAPICGAVVFACCAVGHIGAAAGQDETYAQSKLEVAYTITFARLSVGAATLNAEFKESEYSIVATGHAGGLMRILLNGSSSLTSHGLVREGRLVPTSFTSRMESEAEFQTVRMVLDDGRVKELELTPSTGAGGLGEQEPQGIIDPLSAMLVPTLGPNSALSQEACRRTLPVFDGSRSNAWTNCSAIRDIKVPWRYAP
jgi:hypothetical protein